MCESCDHWVRERRNPFWTTPKRLKTTVSPWFKKVAPFRDVNRMLR